MDTSTTLGQFSLVHSSRQLSLASSSSQCKLEITGGTSWNEYLRNVSNPNYGWRCTGKEPNDSTGSPRCKCQNPLVPTPNEKYGGKWTRAFESQLQRIEQHFNTTAAAAMEEETTSDLIKNLDVVFLGDSIIEHWGGEGFGKSKGRLHGSAKGFESLFGNATTLTPGSKSTGDELLLGMPLGISADRCPNLLYRLQNGVLDPHRHTSRRLDPLIWWILIGTNDRGGAKCLENHVIAGTIAIVEYLRQERPNAKIVINSILPRGPETPEGLEHWKERYQPINQALKCYAKGRGDKVLFFNATDLFLTSDGRSINQTLLPDGLHPKEEGYWVWGRAIAKKIQSILARIRTSSLEN